MSCEGERGKESAAGQGGEGFHAAGGESKHTSFEAFAMSAKAGGGNRGTIFSTLTYSVMMAMSREEYERVDG